MSFKLSKSSTDTLLTVDCKLQEIAHLALSISAIDFGIPSSGGLRTVDEQRLLFDDDKSPCDGTIKISYHQSGNALDFYAYVDGRASWHPDHLSLVACAFLQAASMLGYKLQWGGLWKSFVDMPHVQLCKGE